MNALPSIAFFFAMLAFGALAPPLAPALAADMSVVRLDIDGTERQFHYYVPKSLDQPAPLVIVLHGSGSTGPKLVDEGRWQDKADRERFVLAAPDSLISYDGVDPKRDLTLRDRARQIYRQWREIDIGRWEGGFNDRKLIAALIERVAAETRIDRRRIYVAGFSRGGFFAQLLAITMADTIAAVAVVAPNMEPVNRPTSDRPMPFLLMVGAQDPVMPANGERARAVLERWRERDHCPEPLQRRSEPDAKVMVEWTGPCAEGSEVRFVVVEGIGHEWPTVPVSFTNITWEFLGRFRRSRP